MTLPTVAEVVEAFNHKQWGKIASRCSELQRVHGAEALVPVFASAFRAIRGWRGRIYLLSELIRYTRKWPEIVDLALQALRDRSGQVRCNACEVLAYSLRSDVLPDLQVLLGHPDARTRECAEAAIDAIQHQNHHYFHDRKHTATVKWWVGPPGEDGRP
jgi:hypothetical protein